MKNEEVKNEIKETVDRINDASVLDKILTVVKTFYDLLAKE